MLTYHPLYLRLPVVVRVPQFENPGSRCPTSESEALSTTFTWPSLGFPSYKGLYPQSWPASCFRPHKFEVSKENVKKKADKHSRITVQSGFWSGRTTQHTLHNQRHNCRRKMTISTLVHVKGLEIAFIKKNGGSELERI